MSYTESSLSNPVATSVQTTLAETFERLMAQHGVALLRVASSYARSPSDRDDLLQEIAMGVWRALPGFRGDCSERTFLFRIGHNRAIGYLAKNRAPVELKEDELEVADETPDAEARLLEEEGGQRLVEAVRSIPILYREAVVLMLEGFEYAQIAEVIGISESNVGARLTRARQLLRSDRGQVFFHFGDNYFSRLTGTRFWGCCHSTPSTPLRYSAS